MRPAEKPSDVVQLAGRSSSHFTRVVTIFAHELEVPFTFVPVHDMTRLDAAAYAGNPALKLPTLRTPASTVFGTENICRKLARLAAPGRRVVWPEDLDDDDACNAQEMTWHGMAAQVQRIFGTQIGKLPPEDLYFVKGKAGFEGALRWLDAHVDAVRAKLPAPRDVSLFEVTLFCLVEHIAFRRTLPLDAYASLLRFAGAFRERASAARTAYRFDAAPEAPTV